MMSVIVDPLEPSFASVALAALVLVIALITGQLEESPALIFPLPALSSSA